MSQLRRRRDVLKLSALAAVAAVPTACYPAAVDPLPLSDADSARYFPQSVASGDPRPDSVVLWVRVEDAERPGQDTELSLVIGLDAELTQTLQLTADAENMLTAADGDHCLLVRVGGLEPGTTYYYRFSYTTLDGIAQSRVARTRTAPAEDSDDPVKFAVMCCQDYAGKYFHVARHIAEQDVDFVLHLGDYVYESVGNPAFQSPTDDRSVLFSAPQEALELGSGDGRYLAAQSLSNYRDLYKLYRSDPDLQALHERHPMIAIWDDHEFSDDCHGDVATYTDGRTDETSPARRAAADQAWFEYMPVDYNTAPASKLDKTGEFPDNFAIYRSFVFGQHLELILTDLRRFRPDHLVPEGAPPGAVFLTAAEVAAAFDTPPADLVPYVDLNADAYGDYLTVLRDNAAALDITVESLSGSFSAVWINTALASLVDDSLPAAIDVADTSLERGYAYHCLLKSQQFSRVGSRYVVAIAPFEALAQKLWQASKGESERLMGEAQRAWFLKTVQDSSRTFKLWGSEVALQPRHIDLSKITAAPPELQTKISISAEDWDGFPNERRALLKELANAGNVVILSGDLHSFFAGTPYVTDGDEATRVVELTTGSVTSRTWLDSIQESLSQDSTLPMSVQVLVSILPTLLRDTELRPNPHLAFQELQSNGYSLVEVGPNDVVMTVQTIASKYVATAPASLKKKLDDLFGSTRLRTRNGSANLEQEIDGEFLTWSIKDMAFK
jgi:alkaline phosphatase D